VGTTPLRLETIAPGIHDIRLVSDRYQPYDTEIDIEGKQIEQSLVATLVPAWAEVTLSSLPEGATVVVEGETVGNTPATVQILQGKRALQLSKPGFKTWQTSIDVEPLVAQTLPLVKLMRSDGQITVTTSPPGANVTIADRYRGQTPLAIVLPPNSSYTVQLSKVGYVPVTRTIRVEPDQDLMLNAALEPVLGVVKLMVQPAGGELFVDGKSLGDPNQRLELTATNHEIRITKAGYAPYTTRITPQPGLAQQLMIALKTDAEARVAAISSTVASGIGIGFKLMLPDRLKMGASRREPGRRSNEIERNVKLTRPYYLSTYEVTNEQFQRFQPGHESGFVGRIVLSEPNRPVVNVSWEEAARFCNWLSGQDGLPPAYQQTGGRMTAIVPGTTGYRLPTEAEWDWAARYAAGPDPTRFPWGNAMPPTTATANYADETSANTVPYIIAGYNDGYRGPAPVGSFPANEFGIHDLAGNVSEWIHDFYSVEMGTDAVEIDPTGPDNGDYHVIRGSNYTNGRFSELRWTYRDYGSDARPDVGFRIARNVE
jgi:formylglycine-generating enzyme required for sulfatase activity